MNLKTELVLNLKNLIGWRTRRKIVVFSVDDYGNVRIDSKRAREEMDKGGAKVLSRFDYYDALEDEEDLLALYDALTSVKDRQGKPAVFTAFAVPANINFEAMRENGYTEYHYELLPETFSKLPGYEKVYGLWKEGMEKGILIPQYHGREHLNLKVFREALQRRDPETLLALKHRSYAGIANTRYPTISFTAAFDFYDFKENEELRHILLDGIEAFRAAFGAYPIHFNSPGGSEHPVLHEALHSKGIRYIDAHLLKKEHHGRGRYRTIFNYTGKRNANRQLIQVRNCVFEPTEDKGLDWVSFCIKQIEVAFRWNRPAIISSHRVNYCGHIDPENRKKGVGALKDLLQRIVKRWPDVEFMAANELGEVMEGREGVRM